MNTITKKEAALKAIINEETWKFEYFSDMLKDDKEVVLAAVQKYGWALKYASERLKDDKEVVLAAVQKNGSAPY